MWSRIRDQELELKHGSIARPAGHEPLSIVLVRPKDMDPREQLYRSQNLRPIEGPLPILIIWLAILTVGCSSYYEAFSFQKL